MNQSNTFWPNGARMVISVSMQMEAGAQPSSGAESPMPKIDPKYPDLPATKWYEYGYKEGLPRLMDMFDRRQVKVTSHMVGAAVDLHPALAKEIVQRGHEAAGHGQTWTPQYSMTPEQERESYKQGIASIERATGTRPVGFNAFWLRGTPHTLEILQELGFIYHIDDVSRDEPFLINVMGRPFAVVPYTLHMNDIVNYEGRNFSTQEYADDLKREFDMLYTESAKRRRMMSVSAHDRIAGSTGARTGVGRVYRVCAEPSRSGFYAQGRYCEVRTDQRPDYPRRNITGRSCRGAQHDGRLHPFDTEPAS